MICQNNPIFLTNFDKFTFSQKTSPIRQNTVRPSQAKTDGVKNIKGELN
jgi:hypothetical protein